jgi:hypothetical protein
MRVCHLWWKACEQGQGAWASDLSMPRLNPTRHRTMLLYEPSKPRLLKVQCLNTWEMVVQSVMHMYGPR